MVGNQCEEWLFAPVGISKLNLSHHTCISRKIIRALKTNILRRNTYYIFAIEIIKLLRLSMVFGWESLNQLEFFNKMDPKNPLLY